MPHDLTGTPHLGAGRHVRLVRETTFGEVPGAPVWTDIPLLDNGWSVKGTAPRYRPNTNYGGDYRRHVAIHHQLLVEGEFRTLLWPEVAEFLLAMCLDRDADGDVYSYASDHYTPVDPRRYLGLVVESMRIEFSGGGDAETTVSLSMRGQLEEENNGLVPGDFDYSGITPRPFLFSGATLELNGVDYADIESGTLTIENNVAVGPTRWNGPAQVGVVSYLIAQQRAISFESQELNRRDDFNEALRDGGEFALEIDCHHPDGHLLQIQVPRMHVEESPEDGTPDQLASESPRLEAIVGPAGQDILWGVDLATGGTTTLTPLTTTPVPTTTAAPTTTTEAV